MIKKLLEITNVPPRTSAPKHLSIDTNHTDGNLCLNIYGGWSEYKPDDVRKIIAACQEYLDQVKFWECPKCGVENTAVEMPQAEQYFKPYTWVRCSECKKKVEREKLDFKEKADEVRHI